MLADDIERVSRRLDRVHSEVASERTWTRDTLARLELKLDALAGNTTSIATGQGRTTKASVAIVATVITDIVVRLLGQ